jgi:short-subunit dehydrogenase
MSSNDYFKNKVVLITGGSQGIGKELAKQVLENGGKVALTGRSQEKLDAVLGEFQEYSEKVLIRSGDVGDFSGAEPLIKDLIARFGKLDILINNAGMAGYGDVEDLTQTAVDTIVDTNIKGSIYLSRAAIPYLEKGGSILFVSSLAALYGLPGFTLYSLSKMALTALAQGMAIELKQRPIHVCVAYVGFTANIKEKEWLAASGEREILPARDPRLLTSREDTARLILKQIAKQKPIVVHSPLGKLTFFLARIAPGLVRWVLERRYRSSQNRDTPGMI